MSQPISFVLEYPTLNVPSFKFKDLIVATVPDSFPVTTSPTDNSYDPKTFKESFSLAVTSKSIIIWFEDKVSPIKNLDGSWTTLKVG